MIYHSNLTAKAYFCFRIMPIQGLFADVFEKNYFIVKFNI